MERKKTFFILLFSVFALGSVCFFFSPLVQADTNMNASSSAHFAWDDVVGWWDFYTTNSVYVWGTRIEGYASSTSGEMSLDCATSPIGNICGSSNYGICNGLNATHNSDGTCSGGDASGDLSGYAWNDTIGWISFSCKNHNPSCSHRGTGTGDYGVYIDGTGDFRGYAWNDVVGWVSFNCANDSSCGISNFKSNTDWRSTSTIGYLQSSIFDTQLTGGALLNSVLWRGFSPTDTCVDFQFAASNNSSGPWNYKGPSGDATSYYGAPCISSPFGGVGCASTDTSICINKNDFVNYRYLRYKVRLTSNLTQTQTPEITDIILNWNP
jgi:hypothetical protein